MNYALIICGKHYDVVPTSYEPGFKETFVNDKAAVILVAPKHYVDRYLNIDESAASYVKIRELGRDSRQKRDAILAYYGDTFSFTYPGRNHIPREKTEDFLNDK